MKLFGRDPVVIANIFAAALQIVSLFFWSLTDVQQALLNSTLLIALNAAAAFQISVDKALPVLVALFQGLLQTSIAFGVQWSPEQITAASTFVGMLLAVLVRPQVQAARRPLELGGATVAPSRPLP